MEQHNQIHQQMMNNLMQLYDQGKQVSLMLVREEEGSLNIEILDMHQPSRKNDVSERKVHSRHWLVGCQHGNEKIEAWHDVHPRRHQKRKKMRMPYKVRSKS